MTMYQSRAIFVGTVVIIVGGFFVYYSWHAKKMLSTISTFTRCAEVGFPVMETYPRRCSTPDGRTFTEEQHTVATSTDEIIVNDKVRNISVAPHSSISSPLTITGEARGYWYFEASFPAELLDGNGKRLTIGPLHATGDWMTTEFVPFTGSLSFALPTTATGTLILRNDNPSGMEENSYEVRIPVVFAPQTKK